MAKFYDLKRVYEGKVYPQIWGLLVKYNYTYVTEEKLSDTQSENLEYDIQKVLQENYFNIQRDFKRQQKKIGFIVLWFIMKCNIV